MMSHAHRPFTLPCLGPRLPPAPNLWLLLLLFQIAWSLVWLWLREAQRWWSRKLTRQLLLWLRLLFVERVQKWRSPRTYWKNRENVLASANEIHAIFLLIPHTTGRPPPASGGRCWLKSEQRSFVIYRRNTYEQYSGYNLFQNAEFKANFSIKV